ncbi:uncharacterized protein LOC133709859 [Rosa rugosa]|uniref:uncharacterized protein LOC133709859 n=1 Tax=Rosa rugosa TaxID=74645 RepID=UPI002B416B66|nr:uncharacterized protein LOC133709859 [Rosa rugosa]
MNVSHYLPGFLMKIPLPIVPERDVLIWEDSSSDDQLRRRGVPVVSICQLCTFGHEETLTHLFVTCAFSQHIWQWLACCFGTSLPSSGFTIVILVLSSRRRRKVIFGIVLRKAEELQLEKRVNKVEQYYLRKGSLQPTTSTEKDRDTHLNTITKQQQDASRRETAAAKKMRDLLNMFFHNLQRGQKQYLISQ